MLKTITTATIALALTGCMSLGIDKMSPEQIKATNGMATCTTLATAYGRGIAVTLNADDLKKGMSSGTKVTISPECAVSVESSVTSPAK